MSKSANKNQSGWPGLIESVSKDLDEARIRVKQLEAVRATFRRARDQGLPFPGERAAREAGGLIGQESD
jgi:hypothetical protein